MPGQLHLTCTPWRDLVELVEVRGWLFPQHSRQTTYSLIDVDGNHAAEVQLQDKRRACNIISAWHTRGSLPHAVESTWQLTESLLADPIPTTQQPAAPTSQTSIFSIKSGYIVALTRFVTALLDSAQTSKFKVSMYTKATEVGLPAHFVDLRHEATHGQMPTLVVLREAAHEALQWLWAEFWIKLMDSAANDLTKRHTHSNAIQSPAANIDAEDEDMTEAWTNSKEVWYPKSIGSS